MAFKHPNILISNSADRSIPQAGLIGAGTENAHSSSSKSGDPSRVAALAFFGWSFARVSGMIRWII